MRAFRASARKEARALASIWVMCSAGAAAAPLLRGVGLDFISLGAYVVGSIALGAHATGHEYAHRTLGSVLTQPVPRWQLLGAKLVVLLAAVATLTGVTWWTTDITMLSSPHQAALRTVGFFPAVMGLTIAPYLALVTRGTLGGLVFTCAAPGVVLIGADLFGLWHFGIAQSAEIDAFKYQLLWRASVLMCAMSAIAIWVRFRRLEVIDGSGSHVTLPWLRRAETATRPAARSSALWKLAGKELRLQQMTFVIVGLYVAAWIAGGWMERPEERLVPWQQLNILYAGLLSVLIGALASAEERQIGTLEWQTLMPLSKRTQFAIKMAVAFSLVAVAALLLPLVLAQLSAVPRLGGFPYRAFWVICGITFALASGSLYVSSLSSSGVRALVTVLPVLAGAVLLQRTVQLSIEAAIRAGFLARTPFLQLPRHSDVLIQAALVGSLLCVALPCLAFAFRNHFTAERSLACICGQAASIAGAIVVSVVGLFVLGF